MAQIIKMSRKDLIKWIDKLEKASKNCLPENKALFDKWLNEAKAELISRTERKEKYLKRKGIK